MQIMHEEKNMNQLLKKIVLYSLFFLYHYSLFSDIKILSTGALLSYRLHERISEYVHAFTILKKLGHVPYIIEAVDPGPYTFFNQYSACVTYPNVFEAKIKNKGVNESQAILKGIQQFNFDDDDIIIKMTGRYFFNSDFFITCIKKYMQEYDAFVKTDQYGQVFTGCFALRYKYFIDMYKNFDLYTMEKNMINVEMEVASYLKKHAIKTLYLEHLDVTANIGMEHLVIW